MTELLEVTVFHGQFDSVTTRVTSREEAMLWIRAQEERRHSSGFNLTTSTSGWHKSSTKWEQWGTGNHYASIEKLGERND